MAERELSAARLAQWAASEALAPIIQNRPHRQRLKIMSALDGYELELMKICDPESAKSVVELTRRHLKNAAPDLTDEQIQRLLSAPTRQLEAPLSGRETTGPDIRQLELSLEQARREYLEAFAERLQGTDQKSNQIGRAPS